MLRFLAASSSVAAAATAAAAATTKTTETENTFDARGAGGYRSDDHESGHVEPDVWEECRSPGLSTRRQLLVPALIVGPESEAKATASGMPQRERTKGAVEHLLLRQ